MKNTIFDLRMKSNNKYRLVFFFAILCFLYCLIIRCFIDYSIDYLIRFFISQLFLVYLPGLCIAISVSKTQTNVNIIFMGYSIGYGITIIEYIVLYLFNIQKFVVILSLFIVGLSIYYFVKNKDIQVINDKYEISIIGFILIFIVVCLVSYVWMNFSPKFSSQGKMETFRDLQFWCSNVVSLKQSFLPSAAYFSEGTLFYHYFSNINIAFLSKLTRIDIYSLSFVFFPFTKSILLVGGIYFLLNQFTLNKWKIIIMTTILFMSGYENKAMVSYVSHVIYDSFGFDIGYAFGFWYIATFIWMIQDEKINAKKCMLNILMWFVCCGSKGPIASIIIIVPFMYCCLWLFRKKIKQAFLYGGCVFSIFVFINVICVNIMRLFNSSNDKVYNLESISLYSLNEIILNKQNGLLYGIIHAYIFKLFNMHPVLFIVTVVDILIFVYLLYKKRIYGKTFILVTMILTMIVGNVLGIHINAGGRSEMYFSMATFIPCCVFNAVIIEEYWIKIFQNAKWKRIIEISILFLCVWGVYMYLFETGLVEALSEGNKRIKGKGSFIEDEENHIFFEDEMNVCIWIRDNTPEESVIINDRTTVGNQNRFYYYDIFSERIQYLESTDLIAYVDSNDIDNMQEEIQRRMELSKKLYDNDESALQEVKEDDVDYIIQNRQITPEFVITDGLEEVYSSGDMVVYRIL